MATIKNLAFKGGGVLGIAYAGAIKVLEEMNLLPGIEKVAGTSAGAITAMLVSLNYSADQIQAIVNGTSFKTFEDKENPLRIPFTYGLYAGDSLLKFIQNGVTGTGYNLPGVSSTGLNANATFADFKNHADKKGIKTKDLHVFSTDLNMQVVQEFSFETTPDTIVAEAVRASMSIPMFFKAWQFSNHKPNNHIFVDGGVVYNYPLTAFDPESGINPETLGFYLTDDKPPVDNGLTMDHIGKYVKFLFETVLDSQVIDFEKDPEMRDRTVLIDDFGLSATDFALTTDDETKLYNSGIAGTKKYFATHP